MTIIDLQDDLSRARHYVVAVRAALANARMGLPWEDISALASVLWDAEEKLEDLEKKISSEGVTNISVLEAA